MAHYAEIAGVKRDIQRGEEFQKPVIQAITDALDQAFFAFGADGVNHVPAIPDLLNERQQFFGRILKVRVHDGDDGAAGVHQPGRNSGLVAEITG